MQTQREMKEKLEALQSKASVRILAMESSCDETAAAIVENGRHIVSSVIFSQVDTHALYGGVVPEIASRAHMDACDRVIDRALQEAGMALSDVDALAVTYGPGLVGALLTGVNCMKGLSYTTRLPLIPVNHIEGHVSANFLTTPDLEPPFLCLVVSGGHSHLTRVNAYGDYTLLGQTVDDAAGEAFDKAARVLGLNYPGGPLLSRLAEGGDDTFLPLPHPHPDGRYDFSFSGLKTASLNACHKMEQKGEALPRADLAASFERAVVDDKSTWVEPKNPYFSHWEDEDAVRMILAEFGLDPERGHIINGHTPVKAKKGESPVKAGGRLFIIDGGFCKAYQATTGIAGYTLIYSSHGIRLKSHRPFEGVAKVLSENADMESDSVPVEFFPTRRYISDTDEGGRLRRRIEALNALLAAYRAGQLQQSR